jgi:hypothetical protein
MEVAYARHFSKPAAAGQVYVQSIALWVISGPGLRARSLVGKGGKFESANFCNLEFMVARVVPALKSAKIVILRIALLNVVYRRGKNFRGALHHVAKVTNAGHGLCMKRLEMAVWHALSCSKLSPVIESNAQWIVWFLRLAIGPYATKAVVLVFK